MLGGDVWWTNSGGDPAKCPSWICSELFFVENDDVGPHPQGYILNGKNLDIGNHGMGGWRSVDIDTMSSFFVIIFLF